MIRSRVLVFVTALVVTLVFAASVQAARPTVEFELWTGVEPNQINTPYEDISTLTPYFPSSPNDTTGAAMIVCPGGDYAYLSEDEGEPFAAWLNELGISAFVLKYRLSVNGYHYPSQILDAQRAIRTVRAHALDWDLDPNRVGIIGAAAGGHLAALTLVHYDDGDPNALDPNERVRSRPDLGVLCYPVISMNDPNTHEGSRNHLLGDEVSDVNLLDYLSAELHVSPNTPPAFIMTTEPDPNIPVANSSLFAEALEANEVPYEFHLFEYEQPSGGRGRKADPVQGVGLGSDPGDTVNYHAWTGECAHWLYEAGYGLPHLGNIWPLGDSITYGAAAPSSIPGGYRKPLYENLFAQGYDFKFVGTVNSNSTTKLTNAGQQWHDGHSGYAIADFTIPGRNYSGLYDEVEAWIDKLDQKPDMILLMIGINDLNQKNDVTGAADRLDLLITRLFTLLPNVRLLIASVLDADSDNAYRHVPPNTDLHEPILNYNAGIASIVATRQGLGQNIEFVDMYAGFTLDDLSDGLHPTESGYNKMADIWTEAIKLNLPTSDVNTPTSD